MSDQNVLNPEYEPEPTDQLEAIVADDGAMLPKEAIIASQRYLAGKLLGAQAEIDRLRAALNQTAHVIAFDSNGWSIEHLVECRPYMSACGYHVAASLAAGGWGDQPYPTGRYACSVSPTGVLIVGEPIAGSGATS